ncbi:MAG: L,D-transpeptidase [Thermoleophilia bacterium]
MPGRAHVARPAAVALGLAALLSTGVAAGAPVTPAAPAAAKPIGTGPTDTRAWTARVELPTVGRAKPSSRAKVVARVSQYAPYDGDPQVLLVLETARGPGGPWYRLLLPNRPNGRSAWVSGSVLRVTATAYRVRVTISTRQVELLRAGRVISTYRAAVGTNQNPTPTGLFAVSEVVPQDKPGGFYGPFIVTLAAHSDHLSEFDGGNGQVALHGTSLPGLLGQAVSHGCVRMGNADITTVVSKIRPGVPVEIRATPDSAPAGGSTTTTTTGSTTTPAA